MNKKEKTKFSKFLSLVLRHKPEVIGLKLDHKGRASLGNLIHLMNHNGQPVTIEELKDVVANDNKQRYIIENGLIYAAQGHSIDVEVDIRELDPPEVLYHGTAYKSLNSIFKDGITPQSRQYVHLSTDVETATGVGKRHGTPTVLTINTIGMSRDGFKFYLAKNNVWLTRIIPVIYIER